MTYFDDSSSTKFDSGTGWPSFYQCETDACAIHKDYAYGMTREEVVCRKVDALDLLSF